MRAALVVHRIAADRRRNLATMLRLAEAAVAAGAELVLFPEAALTGLVNRDEPAYDLPLGETIPGPATAVLGAFAKEHRIWLAAGLLEREGDCLYDSAVLLGPDGAIRLSYRRIQPQWHGRNADPNVYRQGTGVVTAETPFGSVAFLVCGDLFDDRVLDQLATARPDWLLFPFARCFGDGTIDQERWDREELPDYLARVRKAGVPTLMANYVGTDLLGDNSFGGAFAVSACGEALASLPLGREGFLLLDLAEAQRP